MQQAVLAELSWDPSITAGHIGVTAANGVVTLSGHVGTFAEKRAAEAAAGRVCGVKAIAEKIEVQLPFAMKREDDQIAAYLADGTLPPRVAGDGADTTCAPLPQPDPGAAARASVAPSALARAERAMQALRLRVAARG